MEVYIVKSGLALVGIEAIIVSKNIFSFAFEI